MTKIDWNKFPVVPGFDAIECKRKVQAEIYEETKYMTPEEQRERLRQVVERADQRRAERAKPAEANG
jgi:hypothetical protein